MKNKIYDNLYHSLKRFIDIFFSIIGIIVLIPTSLIIKIIYVLDKDYETIFYTQYRIGKDGKIFKLYKYRTMYLDADKKLDEILKNNKKLLREYKLNKKLKNDPRLTRFGKIIRLKSIDELPQFINILKGDMSLIGNRPYLLSEKDDMKDYYYDIVKTKPGLTGLWQTSGRNNITFKKRLQLEKFYSNNYGFIIDFKIFLRTFIVVLVSSGAK